MANPQNQNFHFSFDAITEYLKSLLVGFNFPDGAITLHVTEKGEGEDGISTEEMDEDLLLRHCLTKPCINDYGLSFFFEVCKEMVISKEFIECLYRAIVKITKTQPKETTELPTIPEAKDDGTPLTEEEKQSIEKQIEEVKTQNDAIEKENDELAQLQNKIRIEYRSHDFDQNKECALVKLLNFREVQKDPVATGAESPKRNADKPGDGSKDDIDLDDSRRESMKSMEKDEGTFEDVPQKIILINPVLSDGQRVIVVHSEAQMGLRKMLIDNAKKHFKELEKLDTNSVFSHPKNKSELLEEKFLDHITTKPSPLPVPVFDFQNNTPPPPEEPEQPTPPTE